MPVKMELREDGHVIYYKITDPWSLGDLGAVHGQELAWGEQATHKLHALVDVMEVKHIPTGWLTIHRSSQTRGHRNAGHMAIVSGRGFVRAMAETICRLMSFERAKFFNTEAEAWAYLRALIAEEAAAKAS